jgi:hypothetical protein
MDGENLLDRPIMAEGKMRSIVGGVVQVYSFRLGMA